MEEYPRRKTDKIQEKKNFFALLLDIELIKMYNRQVEFLTIKVMTKVNPLSQC